MVGDQSRRRGLTACLAALFIGVCLESSGAGAAPPPNVYILLIDGLDAARVSEALTPTLWELAHAEGRGTYYPEAHAVLPAVTTTNHASVMTGVYTAAHGIVGNGFSDRISGHPAIRSEQAALLEVETLFTVIEKERPRLGTAGLFGKSRLVGLFAASTSGQRRPDTLWGDARTETEPFDERVGYGSDARTMDELLGTLADVDPALVFVALPDVDRTAHVMGPDSSEARKALLEADRQVRRLVRFLKARGAWERTVLMITADHGMVSIAPNVAEGRPYPLVMFGRELARAGISDLIVLSSGGLATILLPGATPPRTLDGADGALLARVRSLALAQPEIAEAWYRLPNPADGDELHTIARVYPDWRIDHARLGELVLVARSGHAFADPFSNRMAGLVGMHGGPDTRRIPILVTGGHPRLAARSTIAEPVLRPSNPDLGATAAMLLGVRQPRRLNGRAVPAALAGRVLREAFRDE